MKVLYLSTITPFPPLDGERIPAAYHFTAIKQWANGIDMLLVKRAGFEYKEEDIEYCKKESSSYWEVVAHRKLFPKSVLLEMIGVTPYYGAWRVDWAGLGEEFYRRYDVIICANVTSSVIVAQSGFARRFCADVIVGLVSDFPSLVMSSSTCFSADGRGAMRSRIKNSLLRFRSSQLLMCERRMLDRLSLVLVQSIAEKHWILNNIHSDAAKRCLVLPNGVNPSLFRLPLMREHKQVLFVGILDEIYLERVIWFFSTVWPEVLVKHCEANALIIGRGGDYRLKALCCKYNIQHLQFASSLESAYAGSAILAAPVYKGYGLINKVLEAMASGTLVVGDYTAFNGIEEFEDGVHGFVADDAADFVRIINESLSRVDFHYAIRKSARELVRSSFDWKRQCDLLVSAIQDKLALPVT